MKKQSALLAVIALITLVLCSSYSTTFRKGILLRYNPDSNSEYLMVSKVNTVAKTGGLEIDITLETFMPMEYKALQEKGTFLCTYSVSRVKAEMGGFLAGFTYDSKNKIHDNFFSKSLDSSYSKMIGKELSVKLNSLGQIINSPKYNTQLGYDETVYSSLKEDEIYANNYGLVYPEKKLKRKSSWKGVVKNKAEDTMIQTNTYTVTRISDAEVVIDVMGVITFESDEKEAAGTAIGTMRIDRTTGLIIESNLVQTISIKSEETNSTVINKISLTNSRK